MIFEIVIIAFLVVCFGFFSGSETALFSLSQIKLRRFQKSRQRGERIVASLLGRPRRLLITILIGNLIVNILASSVSASLFRRLAFSVYPHEVFNYDLPSFPLIQGIIPLLEAPVRAEVACRADPPKVMLDHGAPEDHEIGIA